MKLGWRRILRTLLVVGIGYQCAVWMLCLIATIGLASLAPTRYWGFLLLPVQPGIHLARLLGGILPEEQRGSIALPAFALNSFIYTALWLAGKELLHRRPGLGG